MIDGRAWAGDVNTHRWYAGEKAEDNSTGEFTGVDISSGKVDKKVLKARFWSGRDRMVG